MNFMEYVDNHSVRIPFSGCAIWMGAQTAGGYGRSIVAQRMHGTTIVHRAVFQHLNGEVPRGMYVCHSCDTPSCVNVEHLFVGTPSDNAQDRARKGRSAPKVGSLNGNAVLVEADVREIRRLLAQKIVQREIAAKFGVSIAVIGHINIGLSWGSVN